MNAENKVWITVPLSFLWIARQYSGEWVVFTRKPQVCPTGDFFDGDPSRPIEFWRSIKGDESYLTSEDMPLLHVPDWKESLRFIG